MTKFICKFCGKTLGSKTSLTNHILKAKYCIQNRTNYIVDNIYNCDGCDKSFYRIDSLQRHINICIPYIQHEQKSIMKNLKDKCEKQERIRRDDKIKYKTREKEWKQQIKTLKQEHRKQIQELQDKLENIAIKAISKPTTTTNTQINNIIQKMEPITSGYIESFTPSLTIEHARKGAVGYAEYALEGPFKERLVCVDFSRKIIKFKNADGDVITDPNMLKMATTLFQSINRKNKNIIIQEILESDRAFESEENKDLQSTLEQVTKASDGEENKLYKDFVKTVCSALKNKK